MVTAPDGAVVDLAGWRRRRDQLRAWAAAVLYLRSRGLPAAAPEHVRDWLESHGAAADWYHRGPCGCGSAGCWVLAEDGEDPGPEIHVTGAP